MVSCCLASVCVDYRGSGGITREKIVKTRMLNPAFWWLLCLLVGSLGREISCFLKTTAKKLGGPMHLGDQYIVGPKPKSWGTILPRSVRLLRLWLLFASAKLIGSNCSMATSCCLCGDYVPHSKCMDGVCQCISGYFSNQLGTACISRT